MLTIAVLNIWANPKVPPVYKLLGTIKKLIASELTKSPNIHLENLNHPQLKAFNTLNILLFLIMKKG